MTPDEFKAQLNELSSILRHGCYYYFIWKNLNFADDEKVSELESVLNRFIGFFGPVRVAVNNLLLLQFSKLFDRDRRAVSLVSLLEAVRKDPSLVPYAKPNELEELNNRLSGKQEQLEPLKQIRDQYIAHTDFSTLGISPPKVNEMEDFIDTMKDVFNNLSRAHDRSWWNWSPQEGQCERDTVRIIETLGTQGQQYS